MENMAKDIINVGIGAVESIKKIIDENTSSIQNTFKELAAKGAADQSDAAVKIREAADQAVNNLDDLRTKVDGFVKEQQTRLNETIDKLKESLPEVKIDDLRAKVDELTASIRGSQEDSAGKTEA